MSDLPDLPELPDPLVTDPAGPLPDAQPTLTAEPSATEDAPATADTEPQDKSVANLSPAACAALLAQHFPALFGAGRALPIKLRIQADIQARVPGVFSKKSLAIFLHRYTTSTAYLKALAVAPHRLDLDGAAAGEVADEHRAAAQQEAERRRALFDARRQAERDLANEARRAAAEQARKARAAQQTARHSAQAQAESEAVRQRAVMLRAFETTTLTPANFCALKGLVEADLQAQLALAREERAQRPAEPPRPARDARSARPDDRGVRPDDRGPRAGFRGAAPRGKGPGRPAR